MATILTCYYRPKPGGLCNRLFRAIRALLNRGHTVHYLALAPFPIDHPRCRFHRFPWPAQQSDGLLFWGLFHLLAPLMLFGLALRHGVTHAFGFSPTYTAMMQPLSYLRSIPVTCFLNGDSLQGHRARQRSDGLIKMDQFVEGIGVHRLPVVAVGPHLVENLLGRHVHLLPSDVTILHNDLPVPLQLQPREVRKPIRLCTVGTLDAIKNQTFALWLLSNFDKGDFHLSIFGTGMAYQQLREHAAALNIRDKVTFKGWVPSGQIWNQVDILLMPSLSEGMPDAVLEAIAAGVPVLASDIPAHRSILPANQVVPLQNAEGWREMLEAILRAPQEILPAMSHGQLHASAHLRFDWDERVVDIILRRHRAAGER